MHVHSPLFSLLSEFHTHMLGLTGTMEQAKAAAKAYRVYFSVGPSDEDNEYLVSCSTTYIVEVFSDSCAVVCGRVCLFGISNLRMCKSYKCFVWRELSFTNLAIAVFYMNLDVK